MNDTEQQKWDEYDEREIGVGSYTDYTLLEPLVHGRVLEMGCGRGKMISSLEGADERVGIDMSERAIRAARQSYPERIEFRVASASEVPYPDSSFDLVYAIEVIEHISKPEELIKEAYRLLKPGGIFFVQTPNYPTKRFYDYLGWIRGKRSSPADDYTHVSLFSANALRRVVAKRFDVISVSTRNILAESHIPFLRTLREHKGKLSLLLGQKTIVVACKV